jgi:hypothetical protein
MRFEPYKRTAHINIVDPEVFSEHVDKAYANLKPTPIGVHLKDLFEEMLRLHTTGVWEEFTANLENLVKTDPAKYCLERGTATWPVNVEFGIIRDDKAFCYLQILSGKVIEK